MRQDHLDLVCGEESSGACMSTVPKSQTALVYTDKLIVRRLLNCSAIFGFSTKSVEPQWVEFVGVREDVAVGADCDSRDLYCYAFWDNLTVGESKWFEDLALEGSYKIFVGKFILRLLGCDLPIVAGWTRSVSLRKLSIFFIDCRALLVSWPPLCDNASRTSSRSSVCKSGKAAKS